MADITMDKKYLELAEEYKRVLWGVGLPVAASLAERRLLGKELTLVERFDLIATRPEMESIRPEVLKNQALSYQSPEQAVFAANDVVTAPATMNWAALFQAYGEILTGATVDAAAAIEKRSFGKMLEPHQRFNLIAGRPEGEDVWRAMFVQGKMQEAAAKLLAVWAPAGTESQTATMSRAAHINPALVVQQLFAAGDRMDHLLKLAGVAARTLN